MACDYSPIIRSWPDQSSTTRSNARPKPMPEHRIQLRRVWHAEVQGASRTVDLPAVWETEPIPDRLARAFHSPRLRDPEESVVLSFEVVAGLVSVSLNGQDLGFPTGHNSWEVPLSGRLNSMNELVLLLDPHEVPTGEEWGRIAIAIRSS